MTPDLETELRAALARATAGDWFAGPADMFGDHNIILAESEDRRAMAAVVSNMRPEDEVKVNADLIALAKNSLPTLLDTLTALRAQVEWRPIETAPKDGRPIILARYAWLIDISDLGEDPRSQERADRLFDPDAPKVWRCCWVAGGFWSSKWDNWNDGVEPSGLASPTHWMPLPPAPAQSGDQ